jgi:hypothetical protein
LFDVEKLKICPTPSEPIPILIGGHSEPALKRAARVGDGWIHAGGDADDLDTYLARLAELRASYGREDQPFEIHVISLDAFTIDGVRRLEDAGVTDVVVGFRYPYTTEPDTQTLDEKTRHLEKFGESVIAKVNA